MSEQKLTAPHCRYALDGVAPVASTHAGLWFDKFFAAPDNGHPVKADQRKRDLTKIVTDLPAPQEYADWFDKRWKPTLTKDIVSATTDTFDVLQQPFTVQGRMVIGLGADAPLENSITLHRTYGVPYIPGSALKGLAASYAHQRLAASEPQWSKGTKPRGEAKPLHQTLFGDTTNAGFITFFDALYIPRSAPDDRPLALDVLTAHHQDYYQGTEPPADWDSPIPVPFLSAVGSYMVVLAGPKLWVAVTLNLLKLALMDVGIGAKTLSGYGRMQSTTAAPVFGHRSFESPDHRRQAPQAQQEVQLRQPLPPARPAPQPAHPPTAGTTQTQHGTIQRFFLDRGFGFIGPDTGGKDIFFHIREFKADEEPRERQRVIYKVRPGRKVGDFEAYDIRLETS